MPEKQTPKSRKRRKRETLTIDVTGLSENSPVRIPKNMEVWDGKDIKMSGPCKENVDELVTLILYISNKLNTGPELKTGIAKRVIILKCLIEMLMVNTLADNFHRCGLLFEVMSEIFRRAHLEGPVAVLVKDNTKIPQKDGDGVSYVA